MAHVLMALQVLKSQAENIGSRAEMRRRGIDCACSLWLRLRCKMGMVRGINVGEYRKSWDVLKTVQFIEDHLPLGAPILDIGAYASEVLCALHRLGYNSLSGVDINQTIGEMPYADKISYVVGDFLRVPFKNASFSAVTAISVIEHGFQGKELLMELSRIIRKGGFFIASVDYWPDKIDTRGIRSFGMDWTIFSKDALRSFFIEAEKFNFQSCGELNFDALDRVVKWNGKQYTFAWLAMQKQP
jgi:SAM-dependent methyltransferase